MSSAFFLRVALFLCASSAFAVSARFEHAVKARLDATRAVVLFADGSKSIVPLDALSDDDRAFLNALSTRSPLVGGKSQVVVVKEAALAGAPHKTIEVSKTESGVETVRLIAPNVLRAQIGGTCMLYARIHWLDIAGYYTDRATIYKIINDTPPDNPWAEPRYNEGLRDVFSAQRPSPVRHRLPAHVEPFAWARSELRKGRPLLAAFPREIWQALPPEYIAKYPWSGGSVGHQIVVNGFTWNPTTRSGTFHIVNTWEGLYEFDLTTEAAQGDALIIEESLSPKGEPAPAAVPREIVLNVTLLRAVGQANLYSVETTTGSRKIVAPTPEAARLLVEEGH
jgi:hypothetical protein